MLGWKENHHVSLEVMVELLEVTVNRRNSQATVLFRDQLYDAGLMIAFMDHVSRWRHVLSDVRHYVCGYRAQDPAPESWNEECDSSAALLDHRRLWGGGCHARVVAAAYTITPRTHFRTPSLRSHQQFVTASPSTHAATAASLLGTPINSPSRSTLFVGGVQSVVNTSTNAHFNV